MFSRKLIPIVAIILTSSALFCTSAPSPTVRMKTNFGNVDIKLNGDKAPITVNNFLAYVKDKAYDGTIFHRVIGNFMIQGGGFDKNLQRKPTKDPIQNEADNGLANSVGTIAMARTNVVNSATNQFFINVKNNVALNHRGKTPRGWGYAVFGKVVAGMDVVNQIKDVETSPCPVGQNCPVDQVVIESIRVLK